MKSIQQTEQLSDRELKAVLRGDEASLGSLIREDQPEHQCQAKRNPRLGQRGVFLREHALEGRNPKGGYVPPKEVIPFSF